MSDNEDGPDLWGDSRTKFIVSRIQSTYPKLQAGAKFDKAWKTEENR